MQPTPLRQAREQVAPAVSQSSHTAGHSDAARRVAHGDAEAPELRAADQTPGEGEGGGGTLDEVARRERDAMRPRLRDELGREPTEEELDEWLRRHTEGY